MHNLVLHHKSN